MAVGPVVGNAVGCWVGEGVVGPSVGDADGWVVGDTLGSVEGMDVGVTVGLVLGSFAGIGEGLESSTDVVIAWDTSSSWQI